MVLEPGRDCRVGAPGSWARARARRESKAARPPLPWRRNGVPWGVPEARKVEVGHLEDHELVPAAEVLANAFADEALFAYLIDLPRAQRVHAIRPFMRGMVRGHRRFGELHGARIDGRLVGAAIRIPPGHFPLGVLDFVRMSVHALPGFLHMCLACSSARRFPAAVGALEKDRPRGVAYWYLAFVGVDPGHRRRGVASALARYVLERADEARAPCLLDTFGESTKRLYEARGFEVRTEVQPFADGPPGWSLWRAPR